MDSKAAVAILALYAGANAAVLPALPGLDGTSSASGT